MTSRFTPFAAVAFAALCAAGTVVMPMLVGVMIELFGLSAGEAGRVASFELLGVAAGSLAVATLVTRSSPRTMALAIVGCIVAGNGATVVLGGEAVQVCRFIAGLGEGGAIALQGVIFARGQSADRFFALFFCAYLLLATALFYAAGSIARGLGAGGIYLILLIFCAPATVLAWIQFPRDRPTDPGDGAGTEQRAHPLSPDEWRRIALGLLAMFLFFVAAGGVWVYMERIGLSVGLSQTQTRAVLGSSTIAGAVGAALAAVLGVRLGRLLPLLVGVGGMLSMLAVISLGLNPLNFRPVALVFVFSWMFAIPYLMGTMALLDPLGRAVSLSVGFQNGGQALGPALASLFVGAAGYGTVGGVGFVALAASLLLHLLLMQAMRSSGSPEPPPTPEP